MKKPVIWFAEQNKRLYCFLYETQLGWNGLNPTMKTPHKKNMCVCMCIWDKVFKNGSSKSAFKGCLPQILLGPFLNILSHTSLFAIIMKNQNDGRFINLQDHDPANIYLFKVNRRNWRKRCELSSKLTVNTPERHVIDVVGMSSLITLNIFHTFF